MPHVRAATPADVPRLCEVFREASWSNVGDRELLTAHPEFLEWSGDPAREGRTWLAEVDGLVAGFVSIIDRGDELEVEDLFVDPAYMRRGVATALIDALPPQTLSVDANSHALEFYKSVGFEIEGEAKLEYGSAFRMRRLAP
jgi:ribosomal protein S18 acetylase RimI-like enzyme